MVIRGGETAIPQKTRYALRALISMARLGERRPISAPELARHHMIPEGFLEKILGELRRGGLVESRRGQRGGYVLARPPGLVTLREVLDVVGGHREPLPCLVDPETSGRCADCCLGAGCGIRRAYAEIGRQVDNYLERVTLAEAAAEYHEARNSM